MYSDPRAFWRDYYQSEWCFHFSFGQLHGTIGKRLQFKRATLFGLAPT